MQVQIQVNADPNLNLDLSFNLPYNGLSTCLSATLFKQLYPNFPRPVESFNSFRAYNTAASF